MSWFQYFLSNITCKQVSFYRPEDPTEQIKYLHYDERPSCYIMTIGVIDECRQLGLGTKLIDLTFKIVKNKYPLVQFVYLHVVDYNEAAIRFYIKNNFTNFKREKDHYLILDKEHDAITLYKEVYEK